MTTLKVPGATLHYEVRGTGPTLLLICGGVYDAAGYAGLGKALADRFTVVTYDRRGNSRSPLDGPDGPQSLPEHADDAAALIDAVGGGPAHVFGSSSGAIIGLDLAARYPDRVRVLVAHEPPLFDLLPERDHFRAVIDEVEKTFAADGPEAANAVLGRGLDMGPAEEEDRAPGGGPAETPDPETLAMFGRLEKNFAFFIGYEVPPFGRYVPDYATLRTGPVRIVPAAGEASAGQPPHRAAQALGERLGAPTAGVPGDHGGFGQQVPEFATRLDELLG
ncbi:hydrolase [Asanoa ishikariensis]|uniref:Pimeloyl-ACP methyl ester carboxylesterase n=1 Tax=Asanoa ishikariensis TaxID=137265 RepID=A0A1H3NXB6_9ACTN|nr:alpha/beta hydrolase [Asanoa ishikariensis]GIF68303.1 hydrolase [Asanoa ishikariensis]SDY93165.1 Pimeloyl-ACP methyl ester carboxylesterase [Asanoa ishikariensis]